MNEPKDLLNQLAKLQDKPSRSVRDLSVLEAAKAKAAMVRQKAVVPLETPSFLSRFLSKPLWLGTGSLVAAVFSVFVLFGHQVEPETTPIAASPAPVLAVPTIQSTAATEPTTVVEKAAPVAKSDKAAAKSESKVVAPKIIASADLPVTSPTPPPTIVEAAPISTAPEAAWAESTTSGRVAMSAAAPASAMARKRESVSSFNAVDACVADIKAVPVEKQTLSIELTKQLLERCSRSVPMAQWTSEIDWAKKLLDQQQEKSLLKPIEKPQ